MKTVYNADEIVQAFVANRIGDTGIFGPARAIGVVNAAGCLVAGVVYAAWRRKAEVVELSAAADDRGWLTPGIIKELMGYPFYQLECQMVVGHTSARNLTVRKLWAALGAVEHVVPRLMGRQEDGVLMRITREAYEASKLGRAIHGRSV